MSSIVPVIIDDSRKFRNNKISVHIERREAMTDEASLAAQFIEKWGLVAAADGGEDSTGRQKLRSMEPAEIVDRACTTVAAAFAEFRRRGWIVEIPSESALNEAAAASADAQG